MDADNGTVLWIVLHWEFDAGRPPFPASAHFSKEDAESAGHLLAAQITQEGIGGYISVASTVPQAALPPPPQEPHIG